MGRYAHAVRLALGRSPFEAPFQDDNGDFILGPNVQRNNSRNYVQHFDVRGHPQNLASEASRRRLIRAQNDALSTVGVVVRKAKMNRTPWQTMSDSQKHMLLRDENVAGANCGLIVDLLQKLSTRWIVCFRRRLLTYKSHLGLSLPEMILADLGALGPWGFFFAGLPSSAIASVSQALRDTVLDDERTSSSLHHSSRFHPSGLFRSIRTHSLRIAWFAAEYPFHAFSVLQSLDLVPPNATPPLLSLIPFTAFSPIQIPKPWPGASFPSLASYAFQLACSPFVIAYIMDQFGRYIFTRVYSMARHFLVKPDRPDRLSLQSARDSMNITSDSTMPDMGVDGKDGHRSYGVQSLKEIVRTLFPAVFWIWDKVLQTQRTPLTVELSPDIEEELMNQSILHYRNLLRQDREADVESRRAPRTLRVMAIRSAFADYNLDPDHAMVDIFELAQEMNLHAPSDVSTATPEPLDSPPIIDDDAPVRRDNVTVTGAAVGRSSDQIETELGRRQDIDRPEVSSLLVNNHEDAENGAHGDTMENVVHDGTAPHPDVPLETLVSPANSHADGYPPQSSSMAPQGLPSPQPHNASSSAPTSPIPGFSGVARLPNTTPRPVRRPTETNEDARPTREDLFYQQQPSRRPRHGDGQQYRVTLLSNHPAETLAQIAASLVECAMLIPFDVLFLRSIAHSLLANPWVGSRISGAAPLLADKWPMSALFGVGAIDASSCLRFLGNVSITLGIQALVYLEIWDASAHFTLWLGRQYGWGKI